MRCRESDVVASCTCMPPERHNDEQGLSLNFLPHLVYQAIESRPVVSENSPDDAQIVPQLIQSHLEVYWNVDKRNYKGMHDAVPSLCNRNH